MKRKPVPSITMTSKKTLNQNTENKVYIDINLVPQYAIDTYCRMILKSGKKLFEDPVVKADYAKWKRGREERMKKA